MTQATNPQGGNDGFWLSVGVLAIFGVMIGAGFLYAYLVV